MNWTKNPTTLIEFVQQLKSTRLGLRFEYLFWFWLQDEANPHYQLIQHSIQIIEGKHTKGEIDFLVLNRLTQQIEHWEVALKYYLGEADLHLARWYGLNRSDTLFRKLNHFSEKQFQFSQVLDRNIEKNALYSKDNCISPILDTPPHSLHGLINNVDWDNGDSTLNKVYIAYSDMNGFVQI